MQSPDRLDAGGWRLGRLEELAPGGWSASWSLVAGGWRLEAGGWRLEAGGWRLILKRREPCSDM